MVLEVQSRLVGDVMRLTLLVVLSNEDTAVDTVQNLLAVASQCFCLQCTKTSWGKHVGRRPIEQELVGKVTHQKLFEVAVQ